MTLTTHNLHYFVVLTKNRKEVGVFMSVGLVQY